MDNSMALLYAVTAGLFGLVLGSFFNVVAIRVVKKESIAFPPSHCMHCQHPLKPLDLIPVFSYIGLRGACRYCKARISPIYPLGELATAAVFALTAWQLGAVKELTAGLLIGSILMIASLSDLRYRIIPDKVVFPGMAALLLLRLWTHQLPVWNYLLAFLIGGGLLYGIALASVLILKKEGMGGGDIKLFAFIGLAVGLKLTLLTLFIASLLGTVFGLIQMLRPSSSENGALPFGPFIAAGAIFSYFWGDALIQAYMRLLVW